MSSVFMSIDDIIKYIDNMPLSTIFDTLIIKHIRSQHPTLTKKDKNKLLLHISKYNDNGYWITLNSIKVYSIWEPDNAIFEARKKGIFRYKIWHEKNFAKIIIESLIDSQKLFNYSDYTLSFLNNKLKLSWLYDYYIDSENRIIKGLKKLNRNRLIIKDDLNGHIEESIIKDLLAYIEDAFSKEKNVVHGRYDDLSGYSIEQISESVSYLLFLAMGNIARNPQNRYIVNPKTIDSHDLQKLILLGCKICQLNEWEVLVDFFNYNVNDLNLKDVIIQDRVQDFEKSYRLAYIFQKTQHFLTYKEVTSKSTGVSIFDVCKSYIKSSNINLSIRKKEHGITRLVFNFDSKLIMMLNSINKEQMYLEEIIAIRQFSHDYTNDEKELLNRKVSKHCTLYDVIKFQRVFIFINYLTKHFLYSNESRNVILNSLLPSFSKKELCNLLMKAFGDKDKVSEMIELFTPNFEKKLDLQYTPLFYFDNRYYIPLSLTAKSNILRNCIATSRTQGNQEANIMREPIVKKCEEIFKKCSLKPVVLVNRSIKYKNQNGEMDVFVVTDNYIIIIECKCPLFPVNNFEMRGNYDHLLKATKQLDLWREAFLDINYHKEMLKNWNVQYKERKILTCIVFGNRSFNGLTLNGHPVRFINELSNFIIKGNIRTENRSYRLWSSEMLTEKDVIDYLSDKSVVTKFRFDAMIETLECIKVQGINLQLKSFAISQETMDYQLEKNFNHNEFHC